MIYIVVACDKNQLIGKKGTINGMPWNNSEDLKHFKKTTLNKTIVMGRTTFEAIGRPLPKRKTIIVSHNFTYEHENVSICSDLIELLKDYSNKDEDLYICGGASIYAQSLVYTDKIILSRIPGDYSGDAYFPEFIDQFTLTESIPYETFTLEIYSKKGA